LKDFIIEKGFIQLWDMYRLKFLKKIIINKGYVLSVYKKVARSNSSD